MQAEMLEFYREIENSFKVQNLLRDNNLEDIITPMKTLVDEINLYTSYAKIAVWQRKGNYQGPNNPYKNLKINTEDMKEIVYNVGTYRDFLSPLGKVGDFFRDLIPRFGPMEKYLRENKKSYKFTLISHGFDIKDLDSDKEKVILLLRDLEDPEKSAAAKDTLLDKCGDYLSRAFTLREFVTSYEDIINWYRREISQSISNITYKNELFEVETSVWSEPKLNIRQINKITKYLSRQSLVNSYKLQSLGFVYLILNKIDDPLEVIHRSADRIFDEYEEKGISAIPEIIKNRDLFI